eukprot:2675162-Rhodomonas_salina.1
MSDRGADAASRSGEGTGPSSALVLSLPVSSMPSVICFSTNSICQPPRPTPTQHTLRQSTSADVSMQSHARSRECATGD